MLIAEGLKAAPTAAYLADYKNSFSPAGPTYGKIYGNAIPLLPLSSLCGSSYRAYRTLHASLPSLLVQIVLEYLPLKHKHVAAGAALFCLAFFF